MPTETPKSRPRWLDIGVLLAVIPILLAAARVLLFSGGDPALFRVLVQTLNVPTVLLGTAITILPIVALLPLFMFASEPSALRHFAKAPWFSFAFGAYFVVVIAAVILGPWPSMGWTVLFGVALFLAFWLARRLRNAVRAYRRGLTARSALMAGLPMVVRPPTDAWKSSTWGPVVVVLLALAGLQSMWLPSERLLLSDGTELTAFVLEEKTEWTTVLTEERVVLRIETSQVDTRTVCEQGEFSSLLMTWAKSAPVDAPSC
ncbi:hypothetical protein ACWKWN_07005 [Microbacterium trichothecenolyticum]